MKPMNTNTTPTAPAHAAAYAKFSAEYDAIDAKHLAACAPHHAEFDAAIEAVEAALAEARVIARAGMAPHDAARLAARFAAMRKYHADIAALDAANAALDAAGRKFNAACARPALTPAARTGYDAEIAQ